MLATMAQLVMSTGQLEKLQKAGKHLHHYFGTVEALLMDTFISGQLYLRKTPFFPGSHTNFVFTHSGK